MEQSGVAALLQSALMNSHIIYLPESLGCLSHSPLKKMDLYQHLSSSGMHPVVCRYTEVLPNRCYAFCVGKAWYDGLLASSC